jgi:hypothetical protein
MATITGLKSLKAFSSKKENPNKKPKNKKTLKAEP